MSGTISCTWSIWIRSEYLNGRLQGKCLVRYPAHGWYEFDQNIWMEDCKGKCLVWYPAHGRYAFDLNIWMEDCKGNVWYDILHMVNMNSIRISEWKIGREMFGTTSCIWSIWIRSEYLNGRLQGKCLVRYPAHGRYEFDQNIWMEDWKENVWYDILHMVNMNSIRISEWKIVRKMYGLIKVGKCWRIRTNKKIKDIL